MKPTNEQIEQYRKIVADAPEGATHYSEHIKSKNSTQYFIRHGDFIWHTWWDSRNKWFVADEEELSEFNSIHSLDDIRAIIAMRDENAALRDAVKHIGNMFDMDDGTAKASENIGYAIDEAWGLLK